MDQDGTWHEGGLGPGHIVLDGDPDALSQKGAQPKKGAEPPILIPFLLWPNGWMHQDAIRYGGRPQPRRLCVRWGPSYPQQKGHTNPYPIFGPCLLWPNGCMDEDATWYGCRPRPRPHCVRRGPSSPAKGSQQPPSFRPMSIVAMVAHLSYC